jgi:hypothetical protein
MFCGMLVYNQAHAHVSIQNKRCRQYIYSKIMLTQIPIPYMQAKYRPHACLATVVCQATEIDHSSSLKVPTTS